MSAANDKMEDVAKARGLADFPSRIEKGERRYFIDNTTYAVINHKTLAVDYFTIILGEHILFIG